jgi:hypothetical protein
MKSMKRKELARKEKQRKRNKEIRHKGPRKGREVIELLKLKIGVTYTCVIVSLDTLKCEHMWESCGT